MSEEIENKSARGGAKSRIGVVTSNKMQKTVVVQIERHVLHPKYGKYVLRAVKYKAHAEDHDPKNPTVNKGDLVRIVETRTLSKDKHWKVAEVIRKAL